MSDYSALDKIVHQLALSSPQVATAIFDLEKASHRDVVSKGSLRDSVFVTGLARAGTTILMRALHESGQFASLTYRDMPFLLAPNLWRRISRQFWKEAAPQQRAHGDRIANTPDSPEALDEVFWRLIGSDAYIGANSLNQYRPMSEDMAEFERYVALVNYSQGKQRYLTKNNNTILRMNSLRSRFPDAIFVVPFRNPIQHAASLLEQHRRFLRMQADDRFILKYMTWLGHHEFGQGHKRFNLGGQSYRRSDANTVAYWLEIWLRYHENMVLEHFGDPKVVPVCYEDLCSDPRLWTALATLLRLPDGLQQPEFVAAGPYEVDAVDGSTLMDEAMALYSQMRGCRSIS